MSDISFSYWSKPTPDLFVVTAQGQRAIDAMTFQTSFIVSRTQAAADHFPSVLEAICAELRGRLDMALDATPLGDPGRLIKAATR